MGLPIIIFFVLTMMANAQTLTALTACDTDPVSADPGAGSDWGVLNCADVGGIKNARGDWACHDPFWQTSCPCGCEHFIDVGKVIAQTCGEDIFFRNEFVQLGLNKNGHFGSTECIPNDDIFYKRTGPHVEYNGEWKIGYLSDINGFGIMEDLTIDYFQPGNPEEAAQIAYTIGGTQYEEVAAKSGDKMTVVDQYVDSASIVHSELKTTDEKISIKITYTIPKGKRYFTSTVTVENIGTETLDDVRYGRSFDPDNTVDRTNDFVTINTIEQQQKLGTGTGAVVSAKSKPGDAYAASIGEDSVLLLRSDDPEAVVYFKSYGLEVRSLYDSGIPSIQAVGATNTRDVAIGIYFLLGAMSPGDKKTVSYKTVLSYGLTETLTETSGTDCTGYFDKCTGACEVGSARTWNTVTAPTGNGAVCPTDADNCVPGMGDCKALSCGPTEAPLGAVHAKKHRCQGAKEATGVYTSNGHECITQAMAEGHVYASYERRSSKCVFGLEVSSEDACVTNVQPTKNFFRKWFVYKATCKPTYTVAPCPAGVLQEPAAHNYFCLGAKTGPQFEADLQGCTDAAYDAGYDFFSYNELSGTCAIGPDSGNRLACVTNRAPDGAWSIWRPICADGVDPDTSELRLYRVGEKGMASCPAGYEKIDTRDECEDAAHQLEMPFKTPRAKPADGATKLTCHYCQDCSPATAKISKKPQTPGGKNNNDWWICKKSD